MGPLRAVDEWAETNRIAADRVRARLRQGRSVIVDDTGSPRFLRDGWRALAAEEGARPVLVLIRLDPAEQRRRVLANRASTARPEIVDAVMEAHLAGLEEPGEDERPVVVDGGAAPDPTLLAARIRSE